MRSNGRVEDCAGKVAGNDGGNRAGGHQALRPGRRPGGRLLRGPGQEDEGHDQGEPALSCKCLFRDKRVDGARRRSGRDNRFLGRPSRWTEGIAYRLQVRGKYDIRYGMQIEILGIRPATDDDAARRFRLLRPGREQPSTRRTSCSRRSAICIERCIDQPRLRRLVETSSTSIGRLFKKMPAAQSIHHSYTGGLLEHVWSMTRIASFLADHYAKYYDQLESPAESRASSIAATILHDIGKLRELEYHPVEAKYTKEGCLIGHVLMGRDMVRRGRGPHRGVPGGDAAPAGACDPRPSRQARVRLAGPAADDRGAAGLVHRRARRQDEHRWPASGSRSQTDGRASPTRSSPSTTGGSTRASPTERPPARLSRR